MLINIVHLRPNIVLIRPSSSKFDNVKDLIEEIRHFISNGDCSNIILDLSELNFLDSIRVGAIAATYHFVEFLSGKIYLVVQDRQAQKSIEKLNFCNAVVIYNENQLSLDNIA